VRLCAACVAVLGYIAKRSVLIVCPSSEFTCLMELIVTARVHNQRMRQLELFRHEMQHLVETLQAYLISQVLCSLPAAFLQFKSS